MTYLVIIDKNTGERLTSYVTGVHGLTVEELQALAAADYPDALHVVDADGSVHHGFDDGSKIYKDGQFIDRPVVPPTKEELQAQDLRALDAEYSAEFEDLENQAIKARLVYKDDELADELIEELNAKKAEYNAKREAIING